MPTMLEFVESAQKCQDEAKEILPGKVTLPEAGGPGIEGILSNNSLLLNDLKEFFQGDGSSFFPRAARQQIVIEISAIIKSWEAIRDIIKNNGDFSADGASYLRNCDKFYSTCLMYGITTFGFKQKEVTQLLEEARGECRGARKKAKELLTEIQELSEGAQSAFDEHLRTPFEKLVLEHKKIIDAIDHGASELLTNLRAQRDTLVKNIEETLGSNTSLLAEIEKTTALISDLEELRAKADKCATATEAAQTSAEAELKIVTKQRAELRSLVDEITIFFGKVGAHETKMGEISNEAEGKYAKLVNEAHAEMDNSKQAAQSIVQKVSAQQLQIDEHLNRAVGVSLFKAFDTRRSSIRWGAWAWMGIVLVCVGLGVWLTWAISGDLKASASDKTAGLEIAFFVKLSAAIPIAFALFFSAKQYSQERRAEEEYAFKSLISVSLEPYQKLLQRLKDEGHTEEEFIKKLMSEVFDNPVDRIYASMNHKKEKKAKPLASKDLKDVFDKIYSKLDEDDVKRLKEVLFSKLEG